MPDLVNNTALTVLSRLAMLGAAPALAVTGWLLIRTVNAIDSVSEKVDMIHVQILDTAGNVKLVQQKLEVQQQILADHEARVRALERFQRP